MADTIRILVTLAEHADSRLIGQALEGDASLEVVGYAEHLDDWTQFLEQPGDVVVGGCHGPDHGMAAMVDHAVKHRPDRPVVVMSEASPNGFLRQAFEAGADDVITLPQSSEQVAFTLQKVIATAVLNEEHEADLAKYQPVVVNAPIVDTTGGEDPVDLPATTFEIAPDVLPLPVGQPSARLVGVEKAPMQRHEGGYYIRLLAVDKPGTAATIAKRLAQQNISLESIVQRHRGERPHGGDIPGRSGVPVPVILITYATTEDAVRKALAAVGRDKVILGKPQVIRIEKN